MPMHIPVVSQQKVKQRGWVGLGLHSGWRALLQARVSLGLKGFEPPSLQGLRLILHRGESKSVAEHPLPAGLLQTSLGLGQSNRLIWPVHSGFLP